MKFFLERNRKETARITFNSELALTFKRSALEIATNMKFDGRYKWEQVEQLLLLAANAYDTSAWKAQQDYSGSVELHKNDARATFLMAEDIRNNRDRHKVIEKLLEEEYL